MRLRLLILGAALLLPAAARAEDPSGAATASALIAGDDFGGAASIDVWMPAGVLRLGGAVGLAALSSDVDDRSRVFLPFGASLGVQLRQGAVGGRLIVRGGGWAGATNQGLAAGGWVSTGAYFDWWCFPDVALGAGLDVWFLLGHGDRVAFLPGITLAWSPPE